MLRHLQLAAMAVVISTFSLPVQAYHSGFSTGLWASAGSMADKLEAAPLFAFHMGHRITADFLFQLSLLYMDTEGGRKGADYSLTTYGGQVQLFYVKDFWMYHGVSVDGPTPLAGFSLYAGGGAGIYHNRLQITRPVRADRWYDQDTDKNQTGFGPLVKAGIRLNAKNHRLGLEAYYMGNLTPDDDLSGAGVSVTWSMIH